MTTDMPYLHYTDFRQYVKNAINSKERIISISAPTGLGKSIITTLVMSEYTKTHNCCYLGPYRVATKEICKYLRKIGGNNKFHYVMKDDKSYSKYEEAINSTILMTTGYWVETVIAGLHKYYAKRPTIIFIDEVHDTSRETNLAIYLALWLQTKYPNLILIMASATMNLEPFVVKLDPLCINPIVGEDSANINNADANNEINSKDPSKLFYTPPDDHPPSQNRKMLINGEKSKKHTMVSRYSNLSNNILEVSSKVNVIYLTKTEKKNIVDVFAHMISIVEKEVASSESDILIILPGKAEIDNFMYRLEKTKIDFTEITVFPLYSELPKDEIDKCLNHIGRRIITATNIAQSSITLKNTHRVIDFCKRRIPFTNADGLIELRTSDASKSDLVQSCGRVGRLGDNKDSAYLMLTREEYENLVDRHKNDVCRAPLYYSLMRLIRGNLPIKEILCDVDSSRVDADLKYLIDRGVVENGDKNSTSNNNNIDNPPLRLTNLGKIVSILPLSIRSGSMVAKCLLNKEYDDMYHVALLTAFVDLQGSLLYSPSRMAKESLEDFQIRLSELKKKQEELLVRGDSIMTILHIWHTSFIEYDETINAGAYAPKLWELQYSIKSVLEIVEKFDTKFKNSNSSIDHELCMNNLTDIRNMLKTYVEDVYNMWTMKKVGNSYVFIEANTRYGKTVLDKKNILDSGEVRNNIIPLYMRLMGPNFVVVTKYMSLNY